MDGTDSKSPLPTPTQMAAWQYNELNSHWAPSTRHVRDPVPPVPPIDPNYQGYFPPSTQHHNGESQQEKPYQVPSQPQAGRTRKWRWLPAYNMYVFLLVGVAFALGHHFFYDHLDGQIASDQIKMLRYGALLSFLSKAGLAASVLLAFRQRVWMEVRRKALTLHNVDSLFAAAEDLTALLNVQLFRYAIIAVILALYVWCTPLVVILTTETLTVQLAESQEDAACPSVRSLNFDGEETRDFRVENRIEDLIPLSLSVWNTTRGARDEDGEIIEEWFDYWTGASWQFERVATLAALMHEPAFRKDASQDVCGTGWNCTYTIEFTAPGYKCTDLGSGVGATPTTLGENKSLPFDYSMLAPTGPYTYIVNAMGGEYAEMQMEDPGPGGVPSQNASLPEHLGALRTEPIIYVGYAAVDDPSKVQPTNPEDIDTWNSETFTPQAFACEHYETEYEVLFNFTSMLQTTNITRREHIRPIVDTTFLPDVDANDGTRDNTTAIPVENYILPTDVARYRRTMAYHAIGLQLRRFINGTISYPGTIADTKVLNTRLVDPHSWMPVNDLMTGIESLYDDMLLSILSNPQMLSVVWAAQPSESSGMRVGAEDTEFPCTRMRTDTRYKYAPDELWIVYAVAIALAIVGVMFGTAAAIEQGLWRDTRFSSIVAATRGSGLEKIPWAGDGPVAWEAKQVRVGYGVVGRSPSAASTTSTAYSMFKGQGSIAMSELSTSPSEHGHDARRSRSHTVGSAVGGVAGAGGGAARGFCFGIEGAVELEDTGKKPPTDNRADSPTLSSPGLRAPDTTFPPSNRFSRSDWHTPGPRTPPKD